MGPSDIGIAVLIGGLQVVRQLFHAPCVPLQGLRQPRVPPAATLLSPPSAPASFGFPTPRPPCSAFFSSSSARLVLFSVSSRDAFMAFSMTSMSMATLLPEVFMNVVPDSTAPRKRPGPEVHPARRRNTFGGYYAARGKGRGKGRTPCSQLTRL